MWSEAMTPRHLRWALLFILLALPFPLRAQDMPSEPTAEQLTQAKDAFAKLGAEYQAFTHPKTKRTGHAFTMPSTTQDADLKNVPDLPFGFQLYLGLTKVTDAGLGNIRELKNLTALSLNATKVTDAGLKELKGHKNLVTLDLTNTAVTDMGMKELKDLKNLANLYLTGIKLTDVGLKELKECKNLTSLTIFFAPVTEAGVKELQTALPRCQIIWR
jgi:hypothetical protein